MCPWFMFSWLQQAYRLARSIVSSARDLMMVHVHADGEVLSAVCSNDLGFGCGIYTMMCGLRLSRPGSTSDCVHCVSARTPTPEPQPHSVHREQCLRQRFNHPHPLRSLPTRASAWRGQRLALLGSD